jgi:hypothetical protein
VPLSIYKGKLTDQVVVRTLIGYSVIKHKVNTVYNYCILPHIFFDGTRWGCAVNFNFRWIAPRIKDHIYVLNSWHVVTTRKDKLDNSNTLRTLLDPKQFRPDRKIISLCSELRRLQTKFLYILVFFKFSN